MQAFVFLCNFDLMANQTRPRIHNPRCRSLSHTHTRTRTRRETYLCVFLLFLNFYGFCWYFATQPVCINFVYVGFCIFCFFSSCKFVCYTLLHILFVSYPLGVNQLFMHVYSLPFIVMHIKQFWFYSRHSLFFPHCLEMNPFARERCVKCGRTWETRGKYVFEPLAQKT